MRYALSVPNLGRYGDPHLITELARTAEDAGWDGFFLWDHMTLNAERVTPVLDPWVTLAAVACHTDRMLLGPLVTPLARRRPWKVAREAMTLDHLSRGRAVLGVGLGTPADAEFGLFGEVTDDRLRADLLDEALEVIAALWTGRSVDHRGAHYQLGPVTFQPTAVGRPRIPVWVAGKWPAPRPVRRAARWDGLVPMKAGEAYRETLDPEQIRRIRKAIQDSRESASPFDIVLSAMSSWPGAGEPEPMRAYQDAGVTWWLEVLHPFEVDPEEIGKLVSRGPGPLR